MNDGTRERGPRWRRWTGWVLLVLLVGPMAVSITGCFTMLALLSTGNQEHTRTVPPGGALYLDPGSEMTLHLRNGTLVHGRFRGRTLLASDRYARLFEARATSGGWMPFALGETLRVELTSGKRLVGPFGGYAMRAILLDPGDDDARTRVTLEEARSLSRAGGGSISLDSLLAADVRGELPSAEALSMDESESGSGIAYQPRVTREVPFEEVQSVTLGPKASNAGGKILLGVLADVVIVLIIREATRPQPVNTGCRDTQVPIGWADAHFTDRPFDRVLARFVAGENVAWPDSLIAPARTRNAPEQGPAPTREGTAISR